MKNINYDLVKLMQSKLDNIWRLEKYYINDAKEAKCHSKSALEEILKDEKKHVEKIKEEIKMRMDAGIFD